jgi:RHS repeat-associated protein
VIAAQDNELALDWNVANRETLLEKAADETFRQFTDYDALGRMSRLVNWHRPNINRVAVYVPRYNARGLLQSEQLHLRATLQVGANDALAIDPSPVASHNHEAIRAIRYNAKGQNEWLELGNGTVTTYSYDPDTFRLTNLRTQRTAAPRGLQDLAYTYDPVGNITTLIDRAQETVYQNNTRIEPKHAYVYDALYRLVQATGRENAAAQGPPPADEGPWPSGSFPSATSVRGYTQTYRYDAVGNFQTMQHDPTLGRGWTRHYAYAFNDPGQPASNRLWRTWKNGPVWDGTGVDSVIYRYDSHGNMINLNRLDIDAPPPITEDEKWGRQIQWDWRDMIHRFDAIGGGLAQYHYGIDKQRTRKHITGNGGGTEDRIYLGGFELYRRRNVSGTVLEEIESHHLFEGEQRVLLVDDVITAEARRLDRPTVKEQTLFRYQYGNHLGSVGLELDDTARVISYEEFHPYGTSAFQLMNSAVEAPPKRYRYTGMERDEESGLSYHKARHCLPWLGRWVSTDPIGIGDGVNVYMYSHSSPTTRIDSNGLQAEDRNVHTKIFIYDRKIADSYLASLRVQEEKLRADANAKRVDRRNVYYNLIPNESGKRFEIRKQTERLFVVTYGEPGSGGPGGHSTGTNSKLAAETHRREIESNEFPSLPNFRKGIDQVRVVDIHNVKDLVSAVAPGNVAYLAYFGHAGVPASAGEDERTPREKRRAAGALFIASEAVKGGNLSSNEGKNNAPATVLDPAKFTSDAQVRLFGCRAGLGNPPVAQQLADHLEIDVYAYTSQGGSLFTIDAQLGHGERSFQPSDSVITDENGKPLHDSKGKDIPVMIPLNAKDVWLVPIGKPIGSPEVWKRFRRNP